MWKKIVLAIAGLLIVLAGAIAGTGWWLSVPLTGADKERLRQSPNFTDEVFVNTEPEASFDITWESLKDEFFGEQQRVPVGEIPVVPIDRSSLERKAEPGLRVMWTGHAGVLVEIDGYRVMTDPIFSERASPFEAFGPKRFHPPPIPLDDLTGIDAVVISHNHYDHLDKNTILHLAGQGTHIYLPLGNGTLLRNWNVPEDQIHEMDWWQEATLGELRLVATPARHYSSRGIFDFQKTLWLSWSIVGPQHRFFFSGDSGYSKTFTEIGRRFGPFDVNIIKVGSYGPGQAWVDVHMPPEESVQVHMDLGGKVMLPVHWATFNLARHRWDEPIHRTIAAATKAGIELITPRIGEAASADGSFSSTAWWEQVD